MKIVEAHQAGARRHRRSAAELQSLVSQFEGSGLSRFAFCREHGLAPQTFDRYHGAVACEWAEFVELPPEGVKDAMDGCTFPTEYPASSCWEVELTLGEGLILRLRRSC